MTKFNIDKKGYNTKEVDDYINNLYLKYEEKLSEQKDRVVTLKKEIDILNDKLAKFLDKDEQISQALVLAVEKSEQIENNAKTIYNMEIKRINALYDRWQNLLLDIENEYPNLHKNNDIDKLLDDFKLNIEQISEKSLMLNSRHIKNEIKRSSNDFIKNTLNKMNYIVNNKVVNSSVENGNVKTDDLQLNVTKDNKIKETIKQNNVKENKTQELKSKSDFLTPKNKINSITEHLNKLNKNGKGISLAEEYLNSTDDLKLNAYAKNFAKRKLERKVDDSNPFNYMIYPEPNESGFDLKEALNPKENLDEIMKTFDFFDEE